MRLLFINQGIQMLWTHMLKSIVTPIKVTTWWYIVVCLEEWTTHWLIVFVRASPPVFSMWLCKHVSPNIPFSVTNLFTFPTQKSESKGTANRWETTNSKSTCNNQTIYPNQKTNREQSIKTWFDMFIWLLVPKAPPGLKEKLLVFFFESPRLFFEGSFFFNCHFDT
jgi:hypothetical protein